MANKLLAGISFGLCLVAMGLTVGAFFAPDWVNYEESSSRTLQYGLFAISDDDNDVSGSVDAKGETWDCMM